MIDQMLEKCGDFNRFQYILMGMFSIVNILSSMHYYSQTIISFVPEHWCASDELNNMTIDEIRYTYSKYNDPHCSVYDKNNTKFSDINKINVFSQLKETENNQCNQWIYNWDFGYKSMTGELNWVCDSAWKSTLGQSMFFIGSVVGTFCFGILADKIGRLPVLIFAFVLAFIGNFSTIFVTTLPLFSVTRFISGMATDTNFVMMYILVMEYTRPEMRTFSLSICIGLFYCIGSIITPWIAVYFANWKLFLLATSLPIIIIPGFYFIVPESVQWLIAKNKIEKAIKCFKRVAKFNGKNLDEEYIQEFKTFHLQNNEKSSKDSSSLIALFKTPRLRRHTLILLFKSMVITLCYDAISRNVEGLGLSPFIMFSLSATCILPACIIVLLLQDKIGRKAMASISLLISGIFTGISGIVIVYERDNQDPILLASLSMIARFGITVAYNSANQYATELIPTIVRAQGVAFVHVCGYGLAFFSSYILLMSNVFKPLPSLVLGLLSFAGAFLCLFLPETLNRTIPCTLEDGENFGRGEKLFDFACFEKKKSESKFGLQEK